MSGGGDAGNGDSDGDGDGDRRDELISIEVPEDGAARVSIAREMVTMWASTYDGDEASVVQALYSITNGGKATAPKGCSETTIRKLHNNLKLTTVADKM